MTTALPPDPDDNPAYAVAVAIQTALDALMNQIATKDQVAILGDQVAKIEAMVTALNNEGVTYGRELAELHKKVDNLSVQVSTLSTNVDHYHAEQIEVRDLLQRRD